VATLSDESTVVRLSAVSPSERSSSTSRSRSSQRPIAAATTPDTTPTMPTVRMTRPNLRTPRLPRCPVAVTVPVTLGSSRGTLRVTGVALRRTCGF
jgi:hypothetical protein